MSEWVGEWVSDKTQYSNCDETQAQIVTTIKLKLWQNSKNLSCEKTQNSNCDKTQKPKLWQNSQTQKIKMWQSKTSNYGKSPIMTKFQTQIGGKTPVLKLWEKNQIETKLNWYQNSKSQIVTKLKLLQNSNYDKSHFMRKKIKRVI